MGVHVGRGSDDAGLGSTSSASSLLSTDTSMNTFFLTMNLYMQA